jgi:hypothetical protein
MSGVVMIKQFARAGRLAPGVMNKTEAKYALGLEAMKRNGEIRDYYFEGIKLRLGDNCYYTPDFMVIDNNGVICFEEIKGGYFTDDGIVKWKIACEKYPYFHFRMLSYSAKEGFKVIRDNG